MTLPAATPPKSLTTLPLHVVLVAPEIPWNTGNVGRTCVATGSQLHLVRPLGYSLDDKKVKRAGLDYWPHVAPKLWDSWNAFEQELPGLGTPWLFSAEAETDIWQADFEGPTVLVLGSETAGLPRQLRQKYRSHLLRLPMVEGPVRSLNLSTATALAVYEVLRQRRARPLQEPSHHP